MSSSNADDAGDMSTRKHEFGLSEHLLKRIIAAHTAVDVWFAIDNDALEERRCGGRSANGLPDRAVGGRIFGDFVSTKRTGVAGVLV